MSPFDYVNDVSYIKKNLMRNTENDELAESGYNAWLTNLAFSYFSDTILHSNIMNMNYHLENRPQMEFYLNSLRSRKRFSKWTKEKDDKDLDMICEYYVCNNNVAKEYLSLLNEDQMNTIRKKFIKGGTK